MNGFLIVDKSKGMTSYDVIRRLKRLSKFRKIGYIGTLDRNAEGVLPLAINEGTKLIPYLENMEKVYLGTIILGVETDTFDMEGKVIREVETQELSKDVIEEALSRFKGRIKQRVPPFSSKKIGSRPLYKLARAGVEVGPIFKEVEIYDIKLVSYRHPYVEVEVTCSKGTYMRSLAHDIGEVLSCGAALYALRRKRHGEFTEDMAHKVEDIRTLEDLRERIIPVEKVLSLGKEIVVEKNLERFLRHGMPIPIFGNIKDWKDGELTRILNREGLMLAIGVADTKSRIIRIKRLINQ